MLRALSGVIEKMHFDRVFFGRALSYGKAVGIATALCRK